MALELRFSFIIIGFINEFLNRYLTYLRLPFTAGLKVTVPRKMPQSLGLSFFVVLVSNPQNSSGSSRVTGVPDSGSWGR